MNKKRLFAFLLVAFLGAIPAARADYFFNITVNTKSFAMSSNYLPQTVGAVTPWMGTSVNSVDFQIGHDTKNRTGSEITLAVGSTLLTDGVTWSTSNPGVGIQFQLTTATPISGLMSSSTKAPYYALTMTGYPTGSSTTPIKGKLNLAYRLVRLLNTIPAGKITPPTVWVTFYNTYDSAMYTGTMYSGAGSQPLYTPCNIDAPTEITLPTLYGNTLQNGAQGAVAAPTIKLTNCPGAMTSIAYNFTASYGAHDAAKGVINAAEGTGYASGVYLQLQNSDGTPRAVNSNVTLSNYTGAGNYNIPDFKVAYFIDDINKTTAGNVKSALQFNIVYN